MFGCCEPHIEFHSCGFCATVWGTMGWAKVKKTCMQYWRNWWHQYFMTGIKLILTHLLSWLNVNEQKLEQKSKRISKKIFDNSSKWFKFNPTTYLPSIFTLIENKYAVDPEILKNIISSRCWKFQLPKRCFTHIFFQHFKVFLPQKVKILKTN